MTILQRSMKSVAVAYCLFAIAPSLIEAQGAHIFEKTWERKVEGGSISITLFVGLPDDKKKSSLLISSSPYRGVSVADEAALLGDVTREMMALGYRPQAIAFIILDAHERDTVDKLIGAAARSSRWGLHPDNTGAVIELLNATGAYEKLGEVFQKFGLTVRVSGAEHIAHARLSSLGQEGSIPGANPNIWAPTSAEIVLRIEKAR
jgi:hypothetical protein